MPRKNVKPKIVPAVLSGPSAEMHTPGGAVRTPRPTKPSALLDTRVIYCGDNLEQLRKLPAACGALIYIDPPFNSNRNYEVFWGETKKKRAFEDRHESTKATLTSCVREKLNRVPMP